MDKITEQICKIVRKCGDIILNAPRENMQIDAKYGQANFVTEYDGKVQDMLKEELSAVIPEATFIGEEGEQEAFLEHGKFFIVDPIDGTTPYYEELVDQSFKLAKKYYSEALDLRRSGSAALDLCAIASGRAELFFEMRLYPWDYAAGYLIVKEAGGIVTDIDGGPIQFAKPMSILAKNM